MSIQCFWADFFALGSSNSQGASGIKKKKKSRPLFTIVGVLVGVEKLQRSFRFFPSNIINGPHCTCLDSKEIFWCFVIDNSVSRMKLLKHLLCERWEEVLKLWLTLESHQTLTYEVNKKLVVESITIVWLIFWRSILIFLFTMCSQGPSMMGLFHSNSKTKGGNRLGRREKIKHIQQI